MSKALHDGDSVYRTLFECAGDAILVHDVNRILAVNRKACETLGYTEDELLSLRPSEVDDINHRLYLPERMAKLKRHGSISFETTHQRKDGTPIPVEVTAQSITWDGKQAVMSICRDITRKMNYNNVLLDAAVGWQQTFDAIKDAVFLLSPDHKILRCNKASYRMFNVSRPGEILGKYCWEIVHGTSGQSPSCLIEDMGKSKMRKTGILKSEDRWLEITADPVLDGNSNITGVIHIVSDITERKSAEDALRRKNQVFDVSIAANSIADLEGVITEANEAFLKVWGYNGKDEVLGKPIPYFLNEPDRAVSILAALNETGKWEGSYTARRKDGTTFIAHGMATVLRDENGEVTGYQSAVMDITEGKLAEEALKESQRQYRNLVEGTSDLVTRVNAEGYFLFVNHVAQKIYGLAPEKCIGRLAFDFIHPDDRAVTVTAFQTWLRKGEGPFSFENRMLDITGQIHYLEWLIRPEHDDKGNVMGFVSTARDITDRKRYESEKAELEERNRLLQKSESLDRMAGAVAHHFNNQLHVVMGYLDILIGELPPDNPLVIKLAKVMQAARKASEVSGLLLSYVGQTPGKLGRLDLSEICRMSLASVKVGMPENVTMETVLPSPGPAIEADVKQVQQILANLIENAWEAVDGKEGSIRLNVKTVSPKDIPTVHRFPVGWQPVEHSYACLEVADSGCGISERDMGKLFDPFFSTKFIGRGLGLPAVLGIVRAHGAAITVESKIRGGSIFKVFFPVSTQTAPWRSEQGGETTAIPKGGTVLLVDDDDGVRKMTELKLTHLGFKVLSAKDGVEAVEIFREHKDEISCLLCDLTMPRMGGWETISALRTVRKDLPVILASGYDEATVMEGEHSELPDLFLNKPYKTDKLCDMIGLAVARKSNACQTAK